MSEHIHNDDELFQKAYNNYEEVPSPEVWEKLNARLDQKDAAVYRAKYTTWKRVAVVLLFLLGAAAAYEIFFKPDDTAPPTVQEEQSSPATSSASKQPATNQIQHSNNATDSLNNEAAVPFSPTQNSKEKAAYSNNNIVRKASPVQIKEQQVKRNKITVITETAKEKNIAGKHNQSLSEQPNNAITTEQDKKPGETKQILNEKQVIAEDKEQDSNAVTLQKNNVILNNDAVTPDQRKDSAVIINKKLDSIESNIAANKKSPIKLKKIFKPHFSISPYVAADFSGHQMENDEHHRGPDRRDERHEIEEREYNQSTFSAGLLVRYHFNDKFSLKSGLVYSNTAIHVNPETLYAAPDNNSNVGYKYVSSLGYAYVKSPFNQTPAVGDSIRTEHAEQHASYISIPLMAGYRINTGKRLIFLPGAGFTTHFLTSSRVETALRKNGEERNITINKVQGLAPVYFSFALDAELHYRLSNSFSLMLLPSFKYAFVPTTANHVVKTYPYNLGLGVGFTYKL